MWLPLLWSTWIPSWGKIALAAYLQWWLEGQLKLGIRIVLELYCNTKLTKGEHITTYWTPLKSKQVDKTAVRCWYENHTSFEVWIFSSKACAMDSKQLQAFLISLCIFLDFSWPETRGRHTAAFAGLEHGHGLCLLYSLKLPRSFFSGVETLFPDLTKIQKLLRTNCGPSNLWNTFRRPMP